MTIDDIKKMARKSKTSSVSKDGNTYKFVVQVQYEHINKDHSVTLEFNLKTMIRAYVLCDCYIDDCKYKSIKVTIDEMSSVHHILSTKISKVNKARKEKEVLNCDRFISKL